MADSPKQEAFETKLDWDDLLGGDDESEANTGQTGEGQGGGSARDLEGMEGEEDAPNQASEDPSEKIKTLQSEKEELEDKNRELKESNSSLKRQADASGQEQQMKSERKISELTEENKRLGLEVQESELDLKQQIEALQTAKKKSCKQLHDSVAELGVVRTQLDEAQKRNLELESLRKELEKLEQQIGVSKNANEEMPEWYKKLEKEPETLGEPESTEVPRVSKNIFYDN
jgi:chromosome segregation ATPase